MSYEDLAITPGDDENAARVKRHVLKSLLRLRRGLDEHFAVPCEPPVARSGRGKIRLATWNVRELATRNKYGRRLDDAYWYIAEILRRFDIVALQEVRGDLEALHRLLALLGDDWDYLATDVTEGRPGNGERMVFLYDRRRVELAGVAGELTLPAGREVRDARGVELHSPEGLEVRFPRRHELVLPPGTQTRERGGELQTARVSDLDLPEGALLRLPPGTRLKLPTGTPLARRRGGLTLGRRIRHRLERGHRLQLPRPTQADGVLQFARTPYFVGFRAGALNLMLCTVHIFYGEKGATSVGMRRRVEEIERLTELLGQRARDELRSDGDSVFILLGDFNIVGREHQTMRALERRGFRVPAGIREIPAGTNVKRTMFYDQIAFHQHAASALVEPESLRAGVFDFFDYVFRLSDRHPGSEDEALLGPRMDAARIEAGSKAAAWRYDTWRTFQMSDHLPLWVELQTDDRSHRLRRLSDARGSGDAR